MNATPAEQLRLLELADLDTRLRQAEHARANPPQAARVKALIEQRQELSRELSNRQGAVEEMQAELGRIESDVKVVRARQDRDTALLQTVSNPKDAAGLEHELDSLRRRQRELEDSELEIMERLETAEQAVADQARLVAEANEEGARLSGEAKALVAEATARIAELQRDRAAVAASVPAALLSMYDAAASRSSGAALLRARTCTGCNMMLSGTDLNSLRQLPDEAVATCPECGSILVRTGESGL
ncbi:MAG: C4-type zinc ribbon domain-containing protein [Microbacterium sp.]|uniref:zinc ribbon domain-containing protein n=1 Tax=Microbacterium sp. TaxID=51671 RepID=UPI0026099DC1|nr:C4-type zinc ribbon domain-containing protein [Microbacterium sp.]MCX6501184.1 C4-type zinc ribbon domain-containing protein [Microbacterium sp.]